MVLSLESYPGTKCEHCLRQHFERFEGSLIGNKAAKSEGKNMNNSGTFLNSKPLIYNLVNSNGKILPKILLNNYSH